MKRKIEKSLPDFSFEKKYWDKGYVVIGVDEVGRGALAGPVVAGAVAFPISGKTGEIVGLGINDSKKLTPIRRQELSKVIKRVTVGYGVGKTSPGMIDRRGIVWATQRAMRMAVAKAIAKVKSSRPKRRGSPRAANLKIKSFLLIDAFHVKYVPGVGLKNQLPIIKGDEKSISIAAASIIAKVYRDRLMEKLSKKCDRWSLYGWERNKGYGTKKHLVSIKKYGISRWHRATFLRNVKDKF